jgi:6-phosphofructokinase
LDYDLQKDLHLTNDEVKAVESFVHQGGRVHGQTPDELRSAALKIVAESLELAIRSKQKAPEFWGKYRVFTNEPRHLIRAIPPSSADVASGERLGILAVDGAMAGYTDFMVSQWLTEYVFVPLKLVVLGRKRVPPEGIFWRTVLANTGQPNEELPPWNKAREVQGL